jgi:hypothetical protein
MGMEQPLFMFLGFLGLSWMGIEDGRRVNLTPQDPLGSGVHPVYQCLFVLVSSWRSPSAAERSTIKAKVSTLSLLL